MVGHGIVLGLLALAPSAPPAPVARPTATPPITRSEAQTYAANVLSIARRVRDECVREVGLRELVPAAVNGLYRAAGEPVPAAVSESLAGARTEAAHQEVLTNARVSLGDRPALSGHRAYVLSVESLSRAADLYCGLALDARTSVASLDPEFGLGFELDGAGGTDWLVYSLDLMLPGDRRVTDPARLPRPPVPAPWRVKRVIPGSPAAAAGLRTGDRIVAFDGRAVTPESNPQLVPELVTCADRASTGGEARALSLRVIRDGEAEPVPVALRVERYSPESVFGYARRPDGRWDLFPDPATKIGYIRLGPFETQAAEAFRDLLGQLAEEGAVGLVLDLRWNPGGYVTPTYQIAGQFLKPDQVVSKVKYRLAQRPGAPDPFPPPAAGRQWAMSLPLAVLVNAETTGGGEMVAAALQDHGRAVVIGQRTAGKASVTNTFPTGIPGLSYRVTTGHSYRPTGKPRQRFPDSQPGDEWGVRPDPGCVVPTTPAYSRRLREWAEWQACRPPGSRAALPLDDPLSDPQRVLAEKLLLERIRGARAR